ncbi:MAG: hypothetical protein KatS3mg077_1806 [Candidatus Binatia bacterium]|nr:MAG: hypothetical protein KatS3mg077_1806 [Candidatus Binatia bacterium]
MSAVRGEGGCRIRVGCCGWAAARSRYFAALDTVEVQQTFYDPPRASTLERWRAAAPPGFAFTVKCSQLVTHERNSPTYRRLRRRLPANAVVGAFRDNEWVRAAWRETLECARVLEAPIVLIQTPARFEPEPENLRRLRAFAGWEKHPEVRIAFEPRGPKWTAERTDALCRELGWLRAGDPFVLPPPDAAGQPEAYFRLHGRSGYRYEFSEDDLRHVAHWARAYAMAWVFFNNVAMWNDARRFRSLLARSTAGDRGSAPA